ncbi:hypothetical protein BKC12_22975 [Salmonella enterica subsp. enterica serovar Typhimurium]|uniref:Uncharacterized protein n=1 Tax=Salmonella enterica subsp. enterica serovar Bovismorbificans TaxID=58097 RepID=A0A655EQV8_SALET|nr:hypothetical protein BKC12_22975 [Salmonella enterica subsp. enterica serovar Typhimurium]CNV31498.1 Uncharacterised protein [Salmonella enterica subsp. enterica serovar Bovismorbificans]
MVKLLRMRAAGGAFKARGQVILQISGKKNTALFEIITVAQQDFTCRGKSRHGMLLNSDWRRL